MKTLEKLLKRLGGFARASSTLAFRRNLDGMAGSFGVLSPVAMPTHTGFCVRETGGAVELNSAWLGSSSSSSAVGHPFRRAWDCACRTGNRWCERLTALLERYAQEDPAGPEWEVKQTYPELKWLRHVEACLIAHKVKRRAELGLPPGPKEMPSPGRFPD